MPGDELTGVAGRRIVEKAAAFGLFFYLIGWAGSLEGALHWMHQAALATVLFGSAAAVGAVAYRRSVVRLPSLWIAATVALILLEKVVRALTQASFRTRDDVAESVLLALFFLAVLNAPSIRTSIVWGLAGAAACWSLIGTYWSLHGGYRELALPLGNRALMAGLLVSVLPAVLGLVGKHGKTRFGAGAALLAATIGWAMVRTRSAAAVLLLCAVVFAFGCLYAPRTRVIAALGIVAIGVTLALSSVAQFGPFQRVSSVLAGHGDPTASWNNRARYWEGASELIAARPVFGHGPGQVGLVYGAHRIQQAGLAPHGEVVADVHNLPLNWLVEYGAWGAGWRVLGFVLWLAAAIRAARRSDGLQGAAAISLAVYGVYSLAHFQLTNPAILISLIALAAVATPTAEVKLSRQRIRVLGSGVVITAACVALASQSRSIMANRLYSSGTRMDGNAGVSRMLRATALDPAGGVYDLGAALRIEKLYFEGEHAAADASFLRDAADRHYLEALQHQGLISSSTAAFGRFLLRSGRPCRAAEFLRRAVSLDFFNSYSHYELANAYRACGNPKMANQAAAVALITNPAVANASAWRSEPEFLRAALRQSTAWLDRWADLRERGEVRAIVGFLNERSRRLGGKQVVAAHITLSDLVATEIRDDPYAFIFQRKMIPFAASEIAVDGLLSGSWSPQGIGAFSQLQAVRYGEVLEAYESRNLSSLMCKVSACR